MFSTTQYQRSATTLLLSFLSLLQGCQPQLRVVEEETDIPREAGTQREAPSDVSAVAQSASLPTTNQATAPTYQEQPSLADASPLRTATRPRSQQHVFILPKLSSLPTQQAQEGEQPPAKRQKIAKTKFASPNILENPTTQLHEVFANRATEDGVSHYIERTQEIKKLREVLRGQSVCVLHGPGGSGKSTLARHYARSTDQQIAWFVPSGSPDKVQAVFQNVAQRLNIDLSALTEVWKPNLRKYRRELGRAIYSVLEKNDKDLLLVLDNASTGESIGDFISRIPIHRAKVIITTRNPGAFIYHGKVPVADFLPQESITYTTKRLALMRNRFAKNDSPTLSIVVKCIVGMVGCTPLKLDLAISFLCQNDRCTITRYGAMLQESKSAVDALQRPSAIPEVDMCLANLGTLPQRVMRYGVNLDADFIPLPLLSTLLEKPQKDVMKILRTLERFSLVKIIRKLGIKIHPSVQESCRTYRQWNPGNNLSEAALVNRLAQVLCGAMPHVESLPDAGWEVSQFYVPHASRVLAKAADVSSASPAILSLFELMANYQKEVACNYHQALFYLERVLKMHQNLHGESPHADVARFLSDVGMVYVTLGDMQKSLPYLEEALAMRSRLYGKLLHPDIANALNNLGVAHHNLGDIQKGLAYKTQALAMRRDIYDNIPHPDLADSLNSVGLIHQKLGEMQKARSYLEQALKMRQDLYGTAPHPDLADSLHNVGLAHQKLGNMQRNIPQYYLKKALKMRQKLYRKAPRLDVANTLYHLGMAYQSLGKLQQAAPYLEQALTIRRTIYGDTPHPDLADSLNNMGLVYENLGNLQRGITYQKQALEVLQILYEDSPHLCVANTLNNVGLACQKVGDLRNALSYLKQAFAMFQLLYVELQHPHIANCLNNIGVIYQKLDEAQKSLPYFKQALEVRQAIYEQTFCEEALHPNLASSLNNMGLAYQKLGKVQKAKQYFEEGLAISQNVDTAIAASYAEKFTQRLKNLSDL